MGKHKSILAVIFAIHILFGCSDESCLCPTAYDRLIIVYTAAYTANLYSGQTSTEAEVFLFANPVPNVDSVMIGGERVQDCEDATPCFRNEFEGSRSEVETQIYLPSELISLNATIPDSFSILTLWTGLLLPTEPVPMEWSESKGADYYTLRILTFSGSDDSFKIELDTTVTVADTIYVMPGTWFVAGYGVSVQLSADKGSVYQYGHGANAVTDTYVGYVGGRFYYPPIAAVVLEF